MKPLRHAPSNARSLHRAEIKGAIARGINFLFRSQLPYGEFKTYAASNKQFKNARFDSSPFVTAWVVDAIGHWHGRRVKTMTVRALRFLRAEMEGPGVWRYWSSRNEAHEALPPDVDDACCISYLLRKHQIEFPDNRNYVLANRNREGLFYTWMVTRAGTPKRIASALTPLVKPGAYALWSIAGFLDNVDLAVNANVLLYLGECAETRATIGYLIDAVRGKHAQEGVGFYPEALTFYYLLSRAYANGVHALGEIQDLVREHVMEIQNRKGSFGNELATALGICTLLNFGQQPAELQKAVNALLAMQRENGSWRRISAFLGPAPYYGSEELTTALCIQALADYFHVIDTSKERVYAVL